MPQRKDDRLRGLPNWPLMLSESEAAAYVGLAGDPARFRDGVRSGALPPARALCGVERWNRHEIETHLADLSRTPPTAVADFEARLQRWGRP